MRNHKYYIIFLLLMSPYFISAVQAGQVDTITKFSSGTKAVAAEVNGNFTEHSSQINDNDDQIAALLSRVVALETKLASVSLETVNGQPTVRFSGVNVQVVNGLGNTLTINGLGNLLIGYDEENLVGGTERCSLGITDPGGIAIITMGDCTTAGGTWALSHKTGSHYLVTGSDHNYSSFGGLVAGFRNTVNTKFATVSGGSTNIASGVASSVSGGIENVARGNRSSVSGGTINVASGEDSSVSGGFSNTASGNSSSANGGSFSTASGNRSSVSGGLNSTASGVDSSVVGGNNNVASGIRSSVSGGAVNTASGFQSSVGGGTNNIADGINSSVSGGSSSSAPGTDDWAAGSLFEDF